MNYIKPEPIVKKFTCPHCRVVAQQTWNSSGWDLLPYSLASQCPLRIGTCTNCSNKTLWVLNEMVFPDIGEAPIPNADMPPSVKVHYEEATRIHNKSPRAAAALLRLATQKLCVELGGKGANIDDDIAKLVENGLPGIIQKSLDVVRVTGNHAVHPGLIDTDDPDIVNQLFALLNIIVEYMISMPKKVDGIYSSLPPRALEAIQKRDQKK